MPLDASKYLPPPSDPAAKSSTLYEQIGSTSAVNKGSDFEISLPTGGVEGAIDPLPDFGEET